MLSSQRFIVNGDVTKAVFLLGNFPWMESPMFFTHHLAIDMGINLRSRYIGVSQKLLQNAQIHSRFQAMRCERMPESVRSHVFIQVGCKILDDFPRAHTRHFFSSRIQYDRIGFGLESQARTVHPSFDVVFGLRTQRNETLLISFSYWRNPFVVKIDVLRAQRKRFGNAQAFGIKQFDKSGIPFRIFRFRLNPFKNAVHFFSGQALRQVFADSGSRQKIVCRIRKLFFLLQIFEKASETGKMPGDRSGTVFLSTSDFR